MVDMDDIVTHLKLLEFLEGKCHLSIPCLVGAKTIAVITVENLMVGEDTELLVVIDKARMEGSAYIVES
jgi:hypothetical protein